MGDFQLVTILRALIHLLTSDIAKVIFVGSIIGIGYLWLFAGQMPKSAAVAAIIGIGIVFSAPYIATQLGIGM